MNSLEGRVAIVTGAGRGMGREHALLLAKNGAKVIVNDLGGSVDGSGADMSAAQMVVDEIHALGGQACPSTASVTSWDSAQELVATAVKEFGDLHVVVNNAGILRDRMLTSMTEDDFDSVIAVHLKGTFNVTHWAATYWRDQSKAGAEVIRSVINTSSEAGLLGNVGQTNYSAAKSGIAGMTLTHSMELKRYGVNVNCIAPFARTRMTENLEGIGEFVKDPRYEALNISPLVAVLASEKCPFSGKVFSVYGGSVGVYSPWSIVAEVRTDGTWDVDELAMAVQRLPQKIKVSKQAAAIAAEAGR
jgi:NAD(P)-dependent dehydrogenase (short-subunit alcohol dehydrogenase family)